MTQHNGLELPALEAGSMDGPDLIAGYQQVVTDIEVAILSLQATAPKREDYIHKPHGRVAWMKALNEHQHRRGRLQAVQAELETMIKGLEELLCICK